MKRKLFASALAVGLLAGTLAACGQKEDGVRTELEAATAFSFDFNTGDYSFTGGASVKSNTQFYMIRIYSAENDTNVLATSDRIDVTKENKYTGSMDISLNPGSYNAVCTHYASGGFTSAKASIAGKATALLKPTVTCYWTEEGPETSVTINVSASNPEGTTYTVTLKKDDAVIWSDAAFKGGEKNIKASDCADGTTIAKTDKITLEASANASGEYVASAVAKTEAAEKQQGGPGGGGPGGGGMGGGGQSASIPSTLEFDTTAATVSVKAGDTSYLSWTGTLDNPAREGCDYSWTFVNGDAGWPFAWDCYLECKTGGAAHFYMAGGGPLSTTEKNGTWTAAGTVVSINF